MRKIYILLFILGLFSFNILGATKYVSTTGSNANPGTIGSPYLTVAYAITQASAGDVIYISNGTYAEHSLAVNKSLSFEGESEAGVVFDNSNVAGQRCFNITGAGADVNFHNITIQNYTDGDGTAIYAYKANGKVTLRDVTIQNCTVSSSTYDGAVLVYFDTGATTADSVSFKRCTFLNITNSGNTEGTAITIGSYTYDYDYSVLIDGCVFDNCDNNNAALDEGAVSINSGYSVTIKNSIFRNNSGHCYASAIYCSNLGSGTGTANRFYMENCLFHDNATYNFGGAVRNYMADGDCWNSTFVQNTNSSATTYNPTGFHTSSGVVDFHNCIFDSNDSGNENLYGASSKATAEYCDFYGGFGNTYLNNGFNITSDVLFTNEATNDFSLTSSSPAVDAGLLTGAPTTDLSGNTRSGNPDLGCYEIIINTWTGTTSTAWLTTTNWSLGTVPTSGESVSIPNVTNQPIITSAVTIGGMTVDTGADITVSTNSLTVSGGIDLNGTLFIDNATVNADGNFDATSGTIDFTNTAGVLAISSTSTSLGTLDVAMGTVKYDAAGAQSVLADGYYNLEITGSGTKTSAGTITVAGTMTVTAGTYDVAATTNTVTGATSIVAGQTLSIGTGTFNADGTFTANSTGIIDFTGAGNLILSNTVTNLGALDAALGTVKYDATGAQSVLADAYFSLEIGGTGTKTSAGTITAAGDFTLTSGTYDVSTTTNTITGATSIVAGQTLSIGTGTFNADGTFTANTTGIIDFTGAGNLILSGTVTNLGALDAAMGTVTYDGGTQTVATDSYYNLSISTAGTKTAGGNIDVNGDLTTAVTATCKLDLTTYNLNVAGNISVGATDGLDLSDASCTFTVDGTGAQTITHAGVTGGGTPVSETAEAGLGGFATSGSTSFTTTASYNNTGSNAYINTYGASNTNYLTYNSNIDLTSATAATLTFYHIAKTEGGWDKCYVEYSQDAGATWTAFPNSKYTGSSADYSTKVYFHEDSYATWGTTATTPNDATWWKLETFDMTFLVGQNDIRVRFKLTSDGSVQRYGWILDDITVSYTGGTGAELNKTTVNKASGDFVLSSTINIGGNLTLTSGDIDASSFNLQFTDAGTVTGASDAAHVKGTIVKNSQSTTKFTFPIGDGTTYKPIAITPSSTSSTDWTVTYVGSSHANTTIQPATGLDHISTQEYWNLDRSGTADGTVELTWIASNSIVDYTALRIAHFDGTTDWDMIASTPVGANTTGVITSDAAVTTFSPFTIGSTSSANPLPVELVTFYGEKGKQNNILRWTTASEKNNDYFTIEKTTDGKEFYEVGRIEGAGNSIYHNSYSLTDPNFDQVLNYYRLVQTDFDGKKEYSNLITIDNRGSQETERTLIQITNTWGQEVTEEYSGVVIYIYSDGSVEKVFQN